MAGTSERHVLDLVNAELLLPLPGRNRLMGMMALGPKAVGSGLHSGGSASAPYGCDTDRAGHRSRRTGPFAGHRGGAARARKSRDGDCARGAGAALSAADAQPARSHAGRPLPPGIGRGRRLLRRLRPWRRPHRTGGRRCKRQGHLGGIAHGQPSRLAARRHAGQPTRLCQPDGQGQPAGLRGIGVEPLCHLLLRGLRSRRSQAGLRERRAQSAHPSAYRTRRHRRRRCASKPMGRSSVCCPWLRTPNSP